MFAIIPFKALGRGILSRFESFPKRRKRCHESSLNLLPFRRKCFPQLQTSSASSSEDDVSAGSLPVVNKHFPTSSSTEKVVLELKDIDPIDTTGIYYLTSHDVGIASVSLSKKIESWLAETLPPDSCLDEKRAFVAQDNLETLFDSALVLYEAGRRLIGENANRNYMSSEDIKDAIAASMCRTGNPEFRETLLQNFLGGSHTQSLATGYVPRDEIQPGVPDPPSPSPALSAQHMGFRPGVRASGTVTQTPERQPVDITQPARQPSQVKEICVTDEKIFSPQFDAGTIPRYSAYEAIIAQNDGRGPESILSGELGGYSEQTAFQAQIPAVPAPEAHENSMSEPHTVYTETVSFGSMATNPQDLGPNFEEKEIHGGIHVETPRAQLKYISANEEVLDIPRAGYMPNSAAQIQTQISAVSVSEFEFTAHQTGGYISDWPPRDSERVRVPLPTESTTPSSPEYEGTQLHDAIKRDDLPTVLYLLEKGFDIFKENVHTTIARIPANAIACCVKYRRKDVLSCFIDHDIKCYPIAIWETLRYGDDELRESITTKYEERKRQLDPPKPFPYQDQFVQLGLCGGESLGQCPQTGLETNLQTPLPKTPTRAITYSSSTLEQWWEVFDSNTIGAPNPYTGGSALSQSEFDVEESQEGYHNGSNILNSQEETEGNQEEEYLDEEESEYEEEQEQEEGGGYQGYGYQRYEEEEEYEEQEEEETDDYNSGDWDGSDVERSGECVDGGKGTGTTSNGHLMGGSGSRTGSSQQTNRATSKRSHSQRGNDNGDDGNQNGPPTKKPHNCDSDDASFRCPFYKINPARYPNCSRKARKNLSGMKEHLKRNHFGNDAPGGLYSKKIRTKEDLLEFCTPYALGQSDNPEIPSSTRPMPSIPSPLPSDRAPTETPEINLQDHADFNQFLNSYPYPTSLPVSSIAASNITPNAMQGNQYIGNNIWTTPTPSQGSIMASSHNATTAQYNYNPFGHQSLPYTSQTQSVFPESGPSTQAQGFPITSAQSFENITAGASHTRVQQNISHAASIYGRGQPVHIPMKHNLIENDFRTGNAPAFGENSPQNTLAWGPAIRPPTMNTSHKPPGPTGPKSLSSPFQPQSTRRRVQADSQPSVYQDPMTDPNKALPFEKSRHKATTDPDLQYGLDYIHRPASPHETASQKDGNILPPPPPPPQPPQPIPSSCSSSSTTSAPCFPSVEYITAAIKQSSQETNQTVLSSLRPGFEPGKINLAQKTESTARSGSPSHLSMRRETSTTITQLSDVDAMAATPQPSNPPISPPNSRPSGSKKYTIKIRLNPPQDEPERKEWQELFVNDVDDVRRNFDRWMSETFQPFEIQFSWDKWDLQHPKTKELVCNMRQLISELSETQWGACEKTTTWFHLLPKGGETA